MLNIIQKAVKLLQESKFQTESCNNIYDFLFASYISGEAQQLLDEEDIVNALRYYEKLN